MLTMNPFSFIEADDPRAKRLRVTVQRELFRHAREHPGVRIVVPGWVTPLHRAGVREARYKAATPKGSFDLEVRDGVQHLVFLGEPLHEWFGMPPFEAISRRLPGGGVVLPAEPTPAEALPPADLTTQTVDPTPVIREAGRSHWPEIADSLRERPDVWHRVLGRWTNHASPINRGALAAFRPAGAFEARTRDYELEIRYVGEVEAVES